MTAIGGKRELKCRFVVMKDEKITYTRDYDKNNFYIVNLTK